MPIQEPPPFPDTPGLSWRGLEASDLEPWFALIMRIQDYDNAQERTAKSDLQTLTRQSWVDLADDFAVGVDADGQFRAVGRNAFRPGFADELVVTLIGGVDPAWRGRGVGRALLQWQLSRAEQNIADMRSSDPAAKQLPGRVRGIAEEQIHSLQRLYETNGFAPIRWFTELRKSLAEDGRPSGASVSGLSGQDLELVPFNDEMADGVRLAHNEAFADHWGSKPHDRESWQTNVLEDEAFRPGMSFAIIDTSGPERAVAAYVINCEYTQDWVHQGFTEGYTDMLGVRRAWRGRGLAKHLLAVSAREFAALNHPYATLGVDTDNPSGALQLYLSLGYEPVHRMTVYEHQT